MRSGPDLLLVLLPAGRNPRRRLGQALRLPALTRMMVLGPPQKGLLGTFSDTEARWWPRDILFRLFSLGNLRLKVASYPFFTQLSFCLSLSLSRLSKIAFREYTSHGKTVQRSNGMIISRIWGLQCTGGWTEWGHTEL